MACSIKIPGVLLVTLATNVCSAKAADNEGIFPDGKHTLVECDASNPVVSDDDRYIAWFAERTTTMMPSNPTSYVRQSTSH